MASQGEGVGGDGGVRGEEGVSLDELLGTLGALFPPRLAEAWDNVGLLCRPSAGGGVGAVLLCVDLTLAVLREGVREGVGALLVYHPPLFHPLRSLGSGGRTDRLLVAAIEAKMAVFSPHTVADTLPWGVNTWLSQALGPCHTRPLSLAQAEGSMTHRVELTMDRETDRERETVLDRLRNIPGIKLTHFPVSEGIRLYMTCGPKSLIEIVRILSEFEGFAQKMEITALEKSLLLDTGMGRYCTLTEPTTISTLLKRVKSFLHLNHLRLALGDGRTLDSLICTVGVCAGSGDSLLKGLEADLYLTGEMSHHSVLDACAFGRSIILCEHGNSERGFLTVLQAKLTQLLKGKVHVLVSQADQQQIVIV